MRSPFRLRSTFTTSLSADEAIKSIQDILDTKTKILFLSFNEYFGSINGKEFTLAKHKAHKLSFLMSRIKGNIRSENPTTIETRITLPYLMICFYMIFPFTIVPIALFTDEMTINGIVRAPEFSERILFTFLGVVPPAIAFYMTAFWPLKKAEYHLRKKLKLADI